MLSAARAMPRDTPAGRMNADLNVEPRTLRLKPAGPRRAGPRGRRRTGGLASPTRLAGPWLPLGLWLVFGLSLAFELSLPPASIAQPDVEESPLAPADSVALRDAARAAQATFERIRIAHLPWAWSRSRGPCDEVVGRFCFWHEDGGDPWRPPPEAEAVTAARDALLDTLAGIAERLPGDRWVTGQRVRYLVEAGRAEEAAGVAQRNDAPMASRRALEGYALHAAGDHLAAEAAFDRALEAMPAERARRWADPSLLLDGPARRLRERLAPASREALDRRMWWLADPLWSVPGNERRSEHFARHVLDRMQEDARSAYDVKWGHDLRELLLRYGWPVGFERIRRDVGALARSPGTNVVSHDPPGGRRFLPSLEVLSSPTVSPASAWRLDEERPRSTYAPAYARRFVELDAQVAVFCRGDRVRVVAAWALDPDSLDPGSEVEAAIVVSESPDRSPNVVRVTTGGPEGSAMLEVPAAPAVVSVEALASEARTAGRSRGGLALPGRISDPLVVTGPEALPATLEEAAPRARAGSDVRGGERVGVYLELYPPAGARTAAIAVALRADDEAGLWRSFGRALGLVGDRSNPRLAWTESLEGEGVHPLPVTIELPSRLAESHLLEVTVGWPDGSESVARRRLERRSN